MYEYNTTVQRARSLLEKPKAAQRVKKNAAKILWTTMKQSCTHSGPPPQVLVPSQIPKEHT
jgi:hypothetical protein